MSELLFLGLILPTATRATSVDPMTTRRSFVMSGASLAAGHALGITVADWDTAAPEARGMRADVVADTLKSGESLPGLRALLVACRGVLVAERYYAGADAEGLQPINSATKSVCSMLVGLALRDGRLKRLDETVEQLLPDAIAEVPDSPARFVTLRQILSGRTGLAFDPMNYPQLAGAKPLVRYALSRPVVSVARHGWTYNDAMVALIAPILARAQGADLAVLAARQLFELMGIERFEWRRDRDGNSLAPAGLAMRTRDLLKLSALMVEGGRWQGRQILPESWVQESLTPQGPATWRAGPVDDIGYGLLWFTGRLHGQRVAWAWGYGGQFSLLAPELKLAVATAATSPPPLALREQTDAVMTLVGRMVQAAA
jgi:CubicO group peptidase (beta-lactamase class C family)